jgi:hypothetical protein
LIERYDVSKYEHFRVGQEIKFQYSYGQKSGGNWIPGKCGYIYSPTLTITSFTIEDADGLAVITLEATAHVNSNGEGEIYMGNL